MRGYVWLRNEASASRRNSGRSFVRTMIDTSGPAPATGSRAAPGTWRRQYPAARKRQDTSRAPRAPPETRRTPVARRVAASIRLHAPASATSSSATGSSQAVARAGSGASQARNPSGRVRNASANKVLRQPGVGRAFVPSRRTSSTAHSFRSAWAPRRTSQVRDRQPASSSRSVPRSPSISDRVRSPAVRMPSRRGEMLSSGSARAPGRRCGRRGNESESEQESSGMRRPASAARSASGTSPCARSAQWPGKAPRPGDAARTEPVGAELSQ